MTDTPLFTPEALEAARIHFAHPVEFVMGCAQIDQLPPPTHRKWPLPGAPMWASPA